MHANQITTNTSRIHETCAPSSASAIANLDRPSVQSTPQRSLLVRLFRLVFGETTKSGILTRRMTDLRAAASIKPYHLVDRNPLARYRLLHAEFSTLTGHDTKSPMREERDGTTAADATEPAEIVGTGVATQVASAPRTGASAPFISKPDNLEVQAASLPKHSSDSLNGLVDQSFEAITQAPEKSKVTKDPRLSLYSRVRKKETVNGKGDGGCKTGTPTLATQGSYPDGSGNIEPWKELPMHARDGPQGSVTSEAFGVDTNTSAANVSAPGQTPQAKPKVAAKKSNAPAVVLCSGCKVRKVFRGPSGSNTLCAECKKGQQAESATTAAGGRPPVSATAEINTASESSAPVSRSTKAAFTGVTTEEFADNTGAGGQSNATVIPGGRSNSDTNQQEPISGARKLQPATKLRSEGAAPRDTIANTAGPGPDEPAVATRPAMTTRLNDVPGNGAYKAEPSTLPDANHIDLPIPPKPMSPPVAVMRRDSDIVIRLTSLQTAPTDKFSKTAPGLASEKASKERDETSSSRNLGRSPQNETPTAAAEKWDAQATRPRKKGMATPVKKSGAIPPDRKAKKSCSHFSFSGKSRSSLLEDAIAEASPHHDEAAMQEESVTEVAQAVQKSEPMPSETANADDTVADDTTPTTKAPAPAPARVQPHPDNPVSFSQLSGADLDLGNSVTRAHGVWGILVGMALQQAPGHQLQVVSIIDWIYDNIPGYGADKHKWRATVASTLPSYREGTKYAKWRKVSALDAPPAEHGIGAWWKLLPGAEDTLHIWDKYNQQAVLPEVLKARTTVLKVGRGKRKLGTSETTPHFDGQPTKRLRPNEHASEFVGFTDRSNTTQQEPTAEVTSDDEPLLSKSRHNTIEPPATVREQIGTGAFASPQREAGFRIPGPGSIAQTARAPVLRVIPQEVSLEERIRRDAEAIAYTEKSLFAAYPDYCSTNRKEKRAEIGRRPNRKALVGKPASASRLSQSCTAQPPLTSTSRRVSSRPALDHASDYYPWEDEGSRRIDFHDVDEFLDLPKAALPVWVNGQLAYREGLRTADGRLPRAKVLYKPD
ncbi:hypothetical protein MBLNU230_g1606t1 [Neophaeotheca triangularis]